ncbi:Smr/MutS family protein [Pseudazoarcus pumilus]|uniref:DNA mismatch repair protein MutS n=1 Tax=Pseudazoarcus pumilus TaxID=2067960 RepID=A0A2I6S7U8_9RHOO|nr:Smr/MutS family protein [Pseudazoarcus pumilus]AUN95343.1 DNA mismatch repair protein MutS [Pseudazoarcus pumilus]
MARRKSSLPAGSLDALERLRGRLIDQPATPSRRRPSPVTDSTGEADPEDADLFRRTMGDVAPIDDGNRVELQRPRPAPVPRPRAPEPESETERPRPERDPANLSDSALFRASMADVQPLADDNRVELSGERARAGRHHAAPADPLAKPDSDDTPPLLPADPDAMSADGLFRHAMRGTQRLDDANRVVPERAAPPPEPRKSSEDEALALRETMEAAITFEDRLDMGDEAAFLRPGLPRRVLVDLRRGRWALQGEVDLHGYTRVEAREALGRFLAASLQRGDRCVRVIHGKGLGSPGRVSILKQLSRGWLAQREEILAFCQAGANQGGSGALLVLLRGNAARPRD